MPPAWLEEPYNREWPHRGSDKIAHWQLVSKMTSAQTELMGSDDAWEKYDRQFSTAGNETLAIDVQNGDQ